MWRARARRGCARSAWRTCRSGEPCRAHARMNASTHTLGSRVGTGMAHASLSSWATHVASQAIFNPTCSAKLGPVGLGMHSLAVRVFPHACMHARARWLTVAVRPRMACGGAVAAGAPRSRSLGSRMWRRAARCTRWTRRRPRWRRCLAASTHCCEGAACGTAGQWAVGAAPCFGDERKKRMTSAVWLDPPAYVPSREECL